ncbi:Ig-like domain-containing protein [Peijinzhouia sedimentorum]
MKTKSQLLALRWLMFALMPLLVFVSCNDDDILPITNDLRVLYVSLDGDRAQSGTAGIPVTSSVELVFSHGLNKEVFENNLNISPALNYSITYDETSSFATITPDARLEYDESYTVSLPKGAYGAGGEASIEDFNFDFFTGEFTPPAITLTPDKLSFFEGEVVTITASISEVVFVDVSFDLVFTGTAKGGGVDYESSATTITIPAGQTSATFTLTSIEGDEIEGNENILISLTNLLNGTYSAEPLNISLGDRAPSIELKGVMHLRAGTSNGVRAVHLNVLKDIDDLSTYGIEVNSNGTSTPIDPENLDYYFPSIAVAAGDQILLVRDADAGNAADYFGACFSQFDHVIQTSAMTQNGDDAILLYNDGVPIETFGELAVDGTGRPWEYTGSWGYKLGDEWIYGALNCANNVNAGTTQSSPCVYPICSEGVEFVGIMSMQPSVGRIRAFHLRALKDIPDLSLYGIGIASNGQATSDGIEVPFPSISVKAGEQILVIRDLDVANAVNYFESCYGIFDHIVPDGGVTSNGDDTIELFRGSTLIETYGELGVDGTGQFWDYTDSWAAKVNGVWKYGGADCTVGAATNATSPCAYALCN